VPNGVGGRPPHGSNQYTSHRTTSNITASSVQKQSNTTSTSTSKKTISYSTHQTNQEVHTLKNEMSELKSRVVNMSSNIDLLTNMVQKVTVHDFDGAAAIGAGVVSLGVVGNKRKKMGNITNNTSYYHQGQDHEDIIMPDWNPSSSCMSGGVDPFTLITADGNGDDTLLSGVAADSLPDLTPSSSSAPLPDLAMSTADVMAPSSPMSAAAEHDAAPPSSSDSNGGGDDNFLDDLFQAFADEESLDDAGLLQDENTAIAAANAIPSTSTSNTTGNKSNNVCPKLMKRIEDSLSTIPQEMHELVAKKLIDAISDTKPIVEGASSLFSQGQGGVAAAVSGISQQGRRSRSNSGSSEGSFNKKTDRSVSVDESSAASGTSSTTQPSIPLPIAVSALKTILAEYGVKVECKMDSKATATRRGSSCSKDADPRFKKSSLLPVVPMHA